MMSVNDDLVERLKHCSLGSDDFDTMQRWDAIRDYFKDGDNGGTLPREIFESVVDWYAGACEDALARITSDTEILAAKQVPLGAEFEAIWDANRERLYEDSEITSPPPLEQRIDNQAKTIDELRAEVERLRHHVVYLLHAIGDEPKTVWRDVITSVTADEAVKILKDGVAEAHARAEAAEAERDALQDRLEMRHAYDGDGNLIEELRVK